MQGVFRPAGSEIGDIGAVVKSLADLIAADIAPEVARPLGPTTIFIDAEVVLTGMESAPPDSKSRCSTLCSTKSESWALTGFTSARTFASTAYSSLTMRGESAWRSSTG